MRRSIYSKKALTLMEVLVAVSILTLVFGMTFGAMRIYDISTGIGITKSNLSAQANQALNKMREELSESSVSKILEIKANDPNPAESIRFQVPLPDLDVNQDIQWGDGQTVAYQIKYYFGNVNKANQLIRERLDAAGAPLSPVAQTVLANDITNLQFTLSGNALTMDLTASKPAQRGIIPALSVTASTQVDFKN